MTTKIMQVTDKLSVEISSDNVHEFIMSSVQVAKGYGISPVTLRHHKMKNRSELVEGKHYLKGVCFTNDPCKSESYNKKQATYWTKRGIVRLGFFIKSEQAKIFRDWAEDLIIREMSQIKSLPVRRITNRLTRDRLIDILTDVCKVENKELRESITEKLKGGYQYK